MPRAAHADRILAAIDDAAGELVDFAASLIRVPTVNPPGDAYADCARLVGERLHDCGFDVDYVAADGRPEHSAAHPRINVVGLRRGRGFVGTRTGTHRRRRFAQSA